MRIELLQTADLSFMQHISCRWLSKSPRELLDAMGHDEEYAQYMQTNATNQEESDELLSKTAFPIERGAESERTGKSHEAQEKPSITSN